MPSKTTRRTRATCLALAAMLTLAGCASGAASTGTATRSTSSGPSPGRTVDTTSVDTGTAALDPGGGSGATTTSTSGDHAPGGATTTQPPGGAPSVHVTAPGTYRYAVDGRRTIGTARQPFTDTAILTVEPARGSRQRTVLTDSDDRTETEYDLRGEGVFVRVLDIANPAFSARFEIPEGALLAPSVAATGQQWKWSATSTDGKTTVEASFTAVGDGPCMIDAQTVDGFTFDLVFRFGGSTDFTSARRVTVRTSDPLLLDVTEHAEGTVTGIPVKQDQHSALTTLEPS